MKCKGIGLFLLSLILLSSCQQSKPKDEAVDHSPKVPVQEELEQVREEEGSEIVFDFTTERDIRKYLVGEWVFDYYYRGDVVCRMDVDEDLKVSLTFENSYSAEPSGSYTGEITFDRMYASLEEAPDVICLDLKDTDEPGGDFFFLHRTIYEGKRVMSWFFAGNGNSVFDLADPVEEMRSPVEEIYFEKVTGEKSTKDPRKSDEFYAVYWGLGSDQKSLWLDDVWWIPKEEHDKKNSVKNYPKRMTNYDTDIAKSVLYTIAPEEIYEVLGDPMTIGEVYFVQTNAEGKIVHLIHGERKSFLEEGYHEEFDPLAETHALIFDLLEKQVENFSSYLNAGMEVLFTDDIVLIEDEEYYWVDLGTNHPEAFVREVQYAVNIETNQVYQYDVLNDEWIKVSE